MILSNGGVSLQDRGSDILLESFILNFEILFEDYLRRVLQNRRVRDIVVRDGNNEGKKPLFDDARQPPAQPDIVLYSPSDRKKLIAEVKYKDKPSREDINQAVTYAVSYRTDRAILVHQSRPDGPKGLRHIGTTNGISIDAYAFDLANADFQQEERLFADRLFGLMV
ncbi:hypothetical protein GCM10008171_01710 [Methylopila jiangsuensis]|uniref:Uncharacterized protein n=2 Tax=Methylopila jiangsuensis TaxID=586230 RepID=A0A9W6JG46_9HYPH|nr:hypothetical protein GCM10008171_01710 [Methylopila jiangsuensis]